VVAVLRVPADYWAAHPDQLARARRIAGSVDLSQVDGETRADIEAFMRA
jgi:hypothetical protein